MSRRGENIRKRKDGRWEARCNAGKNESGKTVYVSVYGKTYREVKEKQRKKEEILTSSKPIPDEKEPLLFRDVLTLWIECNKIRLKPATEYKYRNLITTQILPVLGDKYITEMTGPVVNAFLADKLTNGRLDNTGGLSSAYVRSIMLIVKSAISFASAENLCPPLLSKISKPPIVRKELQILAQTDQRALVAACIHEPDPTKLGVLLSLYAGLRIGEVCALRWCDIDLNECIIHIRHTVARVGKATGGTTLIIDRPKTETSVRDVPLCTKLIPVFKDAMQNAATPYVVSTQSTFLSPRTYEYRYHKLLRCSGVPKINYHALRHTFATRCIERGVDVKSLSEMLGHADASITLNTYVHSSMEQKRSQIEKLIG